MDRPRERVLEVAWDLLIERGLADLTLAELGRRVDTSPGHLLYYFGSKDELLLETLRWSEEQLWQRWTVMRAEPTPVGERVRAFCELFLPVAPGDPRWLLWIEAWPRVLRVEPLREPYLALDARWHDALAELLAEADVPEPDHLARRICALLDGFSVALALDEEGLTVAEVCDHALALLPAHLTDVSVS
ncbi:transcriptional regulator [Nocardioides gansuensis]|uniref:Transcriptional regulator n=1 Tax=Nocardioides gansuensis TaxID=2138300 RepID=A0A2T8F866_9ACTN|nr:TetR/AcrR family transcriptional regulator [Nocardioides gansuensis]PVG81918.1 transcriptional regulator [Nocardioides gansuensis]